MTACFQNPPSKFAQFVERVPMIKEIDKSASTAAIAGLFGKSFLDKTKLMWVPPCRKKLEKDDDYVEPSRQRWVRMDSDTYFQWEILTSNLGK